MEGFYTSSLSSGLLFLAVFSTPLLAQPGPPPFAAFDRDGSGTISEREFNEFRASRMQSRAGEGRPLRGAQDAPPFAFFDRDNDGQISPDELRNAQREHMRQRWGQGAGFGAGADPGSPGPRDGGGMPGPRGPMGRMGPGGPHMAGFSSFDLNGDGVVSE
jgi:hypothetical protein